MRALAEIVHRGPDALAASRVARAALRERMQAKPRKLLRWLPRIDRFDASPVEIHVDLVPQAEALMELADWVDGVRTAVDADEPAWPALRAFAAQHAVGGARPIGEVLAGPPDFAFAREFAVHIEATASGALDATTVAPRPR